MKNEKNCSTCINNEDGFCDKKGILIKGDDSCEAHKALKTWAEKMKWADAMMRTFLAGH